MVKTKKRRKLRLKLKHKRLIKKTGASILRSTKVVGRGLWKGTKVAGKGTLIGSKFAYKHGKRTFHGMADFGDELTGYEKKRKKKGSARRDMDFLRSIGGI